MKKDIHTLAPLFAELKDKLKQLKKLGRKIKQLQAIQKYKK